MRPPAEEIPLAPDELKSINDQLNRLIESATAGGAVRAAAGEPGSGLAVSILNDLGTVGGQLLDLIVPRYIQADLRVGHRFLEVGVDESLLGYPWELMHDGDEFLCLKQYMGRFVNATSLEERLKDLLLVQGRVLDSNKTDAVIIAARKLLKHEWEITKYGAWILLRRSAKVTHLCFLKVTHARNRIRNRI